MKHAPLCLAGLCTAVLLAPGCASTENAETPSTSAGARPARERKPVELTPVGELSERQREILLAYGRGGAEWQDERARVLEDPAEAEFLVNNLIIELLRAYRSSALSSAVELDSPFERAQAELVALRSTSTPVLTELLAVGDRVAAFVAGQTLERIGAPAASSVAGLLPEPDRETRRRAVEVLGKLPHLQEEETEIQAELVQLLREDPEWMVRAQAAEAAARRAYAAGDLASVGSRLVGALGDEDTSVRWRAAQGLGRLGDQRAVPALINFMERSSREGDVLGYESAEKALARLLGVEGRRSVREWRDLWQQGKEG